MDGKPINAPDLEGGDKPNMTMLRHYIKKEYVGSIMGEGGSTAQAIVQENRCINIEMTSKGTPRNVPKKVIDVYYTWDTEITAAEIQVIQKIAHRCKRGDTRDADHVTAPVKSRT